MEKRGEMGKTRIFFAFSVEKPGIRRPKPPQMHFLLVDLRGGASILPFPHPPILSQGKMGENGDSRGDVATLTTCGPLRREG